MSYLDFTQTSIWQKSLAALLKVYKIAKRFPRDEVYVLTSDMKRAANSVLHNFAEGFGRFEPRDKTRFYKISRGSAYEVISQTLVGFELAYIDVKDREDLVDVYKIIIQELDNLVISIEGKGVWDYTTEL